MKYRIIHDQRYGFHPQISTFFVWRSTLDSRDDLLYFKTLEEAKEYLEWRNRQSARPSISIVEEGVL